MRLIDADALIEDIKSFWDWDSIDGITATTVLKQTMTDISNAPTIDAEPVVRCKDCKHFEGERKYCGYDRFVPNDRCFCFTGEAGKKEEYDETD